MDNNVVRTLNDGPMGPQGPVKVNHCIMNNDAGYKPVVRLFNLENIRYPEDDEDLEEEDDPEDDPEKDLDPEEDTGSEGEESESEPKSEIEEETEPK